MDTKARGAPQASNRARQQAAKAPSSVWASPGARPMSSFTAAFTA